MNVFAGEMLLLYFLYGLAFFTMALVITVQRRRNSSFILAKPLGLLAGFGLFQAFAEWAKVAKLLNMFGISLLSVISLHLLDGLAIGISFSFLFLFGSYLIIDYLDKNPYLKYLPLIIPLGWLIKFVILDYMLFPVGNFKTWASHSTAWARYCMAFPGAILVSIGLYLQLAELRRLNLKSACNSCLGAAIAFTAYGFFSGLIPFPVDFWPGNILNTTSFYDITGWPVQLVRAFLGMAMAFTVIKTINIFDLEQQKRLEEVERTNLIMKERERFSRDLHDGIAQSIYGAGLIIDASQEMLKREKYPKVHQHMLDAKSKLNDTIAELRDYIRDLQQEEGTKGNLRETIDELLIGFRKFSMIPIDFEYELEQELFLNQRQEKNIYHIIQEALFNIVKHARATKAGIVARQNKNGKIIIRVNDNGKGFNLKNLREEGSLENKGLANMKFRAQRLGGKLIIQSSEGQGTQITLSFYDD